MTVQDHVPLCQPAENLGLLYKYWATWNDSIDPVERSKCQCKLCSSCSAPFKTKWLPTAITIQFCRWLLHYLLKIGEIWSKYSRRINYGSKYRHYQQMGRILRKDFVLHPSWKCKQTSWWRHYLAWIDDSDWSKKIWSSPAIFMERPIDLPFVLVANRFDLRRHVRFIATSVRRVCDIRESLGPGAWLASVIEYGIY